MATERFNTAVLAVCEAKRLPTKRIKFDRFARECADDISAMVRHFTKKWPMRRSLDADDVRQEVLAQLWHWILKWNPARGQAAGVFVAMQTMWRVRRRLLKDLGVSTHRPADSKGKYFRDYEKPMRYSEDGEPLTIAIDRNPLPGDNILAREAREERYDYLRELCTTRRDAIVITALERYEGDDERAARGILRSDLANECGVTTLESSRSLVFRTAARLASAGDFLEVA